MARKDVKTLDHPSSTAFFKIEQKVCCHSIISCIHDTDLWCRGIA
jgi:hypothetical protein